MDIPAPNPQDLIHQFPFWGLLPKPQGLAGGEERLLCTRATALFRLFPHTVQRLCTVSIWHTVLQFSHVPKAIPAGRLTVRDGPYAGIVLSILQMHPVFGHLSVCLSLRVFLGLSFGTGLAACQREAPPRSLPSDWGEY